MCLPVRERPEKGTPADAAMIRDSHQAMVRQAEAEREKRA
jgi:hypothetical protein